jgi:hypothetical protein
MKGGGEPVVGPVLVRPVEERQELEAVEVHDGARELVVELGQLEQAEVDLLVLGRGQAVLGVPRHGELPLHGLVQLPVELIDLVFEDRELARPLGERGEGELDEIHLVPAGPELVDRFADLPVASRERFHVPLRHPQSR